MKRNKLCHPNASFHSAKTRTVNWTLVCGEAICFQEEENYDKASCQYDEFDMLRFMSHLGGTASAGSGRHWTRQRRESSRSTVGEDVRVVDPEGIMIEGSC